MALHEVQLKGYSVRPGNLSLGTFGSYGIEQLHVTLDDTWSGLAVTATFNPPKGEPREIRLPENGLIDVPAEATANEGTGTIVYCGVANGVQRITKTQGYNVITRGNVGGTAPFKPSESLATQILQAALNAEKNSAEAKSVADNLRNDAANGKFNGKDGAKGDKGDTGPEGPAGKDGVQIDDVAVSEDAPWSSKHIIDMLCPPLEESGNPVVCYPVAGYPLGVKAKWEPVQEGSGEPSPENIRPIKGRDSVKVERCGENLLPFGERIEDIYQQQIMSSDALITLSKACAKQKLTLTFSLETQNIVFNDNVEDEWRKRIGFECHGTLADGTEVYALQCWIDDRDGELTKNGKKTKTVTVIMPALVSGNIVFYAQNIISGSFVAYDFGIYAGTTAPTTYTPYIGQTNTLTMPETVYGGEVDAVTGEGKRTWQVKSLDGTEGWAIRDTYIGVYNLLSPTDSGKAICTHFDVRRSYSADCLFISDEGTVYLARALSDKYTVDTWCAYLAAQNAAGTPVQIVYKLAEPVPFAATGAQPLPALAGVNTVLTDADSATVTGRADPIKRIEDLEAAVASIN